MNNPRTAAEWKSPLIRGSLLGFLFDPFLLIYGGFLIVMIALSFAIGPVHSLAMALRWPALGGVAVVGLLLSVAKSSGKFTSTHGAMLAFLIFAAASSLYSIDSMYTFERTVSIGLLFAATFFGLYAHCHSPDNMRRLTDMLWWLGAAVVIGGVLYSRGSMGISGRYEGLHSRATGAGSYAALFLPIAIYQVRYRLRNGLKYFGWLVVGLLLLQIVLAGARMAIATAGAVALALWVQYYGPRAYAAGLALVLLLPVPFVLNPQRLESLLDRSDRILRTESLSTFTGRLDRWVFGLEQFAKKPLWGHGLGASRTLAGLEDPRRFDIKPGEVFNLHSDQIEVLMDLGVIGYFPFAVFWGLVVFQVLRIVAKPVTPERQLGLAYCGSVGYALGDTFMHGGFLAAGGGVSAYTWSMIAALLVLSQASVASRRPHPHAMSVFTGDESLDRDDAARARTALRLPSARRLAKS